MHRANARCTASGTRISQLMPGIAVRRACAPGGVSAKVQTDASPQPVNLCKGGRANNMQRPKKLCDQRLCRKTRGQNREITERTTENRGSAPYIGSLLPKGDVVSTIRGRRSGAKVSNSERDQAKKPGAISARASCAVLSGGLSNNSGVTRQQT